MTPHQRSVQRALEGNERVWFHPHEDKIAVWYGGACISVYNSKTWDEFDELSVKTIGGDGEKSIAEMEDSVVMKLAARGFDRVGRTQDDTRVRHA